VELNRVSAPPICFAWITTIQALAYTASQPTNGTHLLAHRNEYVAYFFIGLFA
jgi:hypothetical protein